MTKVRGEYRKEENMEKEELEVKKNKIKTKKYKRKKRGKTLACFVQWIEHWVQF